MLGCHWGSGNDSCEHNIALSYLCSFVCNWVYVRYELKSSLEVVCVSLSFTCLSCLYGKRIGLSLDTEGPGADK